MAITRAQLLRELLPGLNRLFGLEYKSYGKIYDKIYEISTSKRSFEEDQGQYGFGLAPAKEEGAAVDYDSAGETWVQRYVHTTYALAFAITEEAIEDNLYDSLSTRYTKALARSMAETKEIKAHAVLNNGFTTYNTGDGVTLFSTSHPLVNGGVNANRPAVGMDLNETAMEAAITQISLWTDDRGLLIQAKPQKLIVPPAGQFQATRLLETDGRIETADNDINAIKKNNYISGGYMVTPYLTDPDAWYMKTDIQDGGRFFQRAALKTGMDGDFDTGNARFKARERYSVGVTNPLGFWASPGA